MRSKNPEVEHARMLLGEEFDYIPDKTIELMVRCFDLIAKIRMENIGKESG